MSESRLKSPAIGLIAGIALTSLAAVMLGQGASQPVKSEPQYFVTGGGDEAHLWVREGTNLRVIGHGECKECAEKGHGHKAGEHKENDGHDHGKTEPKK